MTSILASISTIEPDCLTVLFTVEQDTHLFAKNIFISNKDKFGEPAKYSIFIKPALAEMDNKYIYTADEPIPANTCVAEHVNDLLSDGTEISFISSSGNMQISLEGSIILDSDFVEEQ